MHGFKTLRFLSLALIAVWIGTAGAASAAEPAGFTVAVLPDTQRYSQSFPETYLAQTEWIRDRAGPDNVKFVIHLGDVVHNVQVETEWENADRAHRALDGVVPYSMLPGNHDLDLDGELLTRGTSLYNKYFSPARFEAYPWYGGHMDEANDNNYCFFQADGMQFMVLSLEFSPTDEMLHWAGGVLDAHPDLRVILATHCYMRPDGRDTRCGQAKGLVGNSGEAIWDKLVRKHENVFMVLSGHVLGVGYQRSLNDAGRPVHEILVDYQGLPNGGSGWLRTLRFVPAENKIYVKTYSPLLDEYNQDPKETFTLDYQMTGARLKKAG